MLVTSAPKAIALSLVRVGFMSHLRQHRLGRDARHGLRPTLGRTVWANNETRHDEPSIRHHIHRDHLGREAPQPHRPPEG
jgi:hypothetical protein